MLPKLDKFNKKENYPNEENYKNATNIFKLKLIRQFLQKDNIDNLQNLKAYTQRRTRNKENFKQKILSRNGVRSPLIQVDNLISPNNGSKYLNGSISRSGRNLKLNQLYDL